jgi:hypothetical protein
MKYTTLPNTEIEVSKICLGTMTFGQQNTEAEGHEQMDYALEKELIFGTQPRCILFLHVRKPTGILKELLEPGQKKQEEEKRWFSLLK